jgi:O-antigen biosynthesis protein
MKARVQTDGKHLSLDGAPFKVRGVTYGSFVPRIDGEPFPDRTQVKKDFADMESAGINVVRTYTLPPPDVLELAEEMGLRLIVGLHYEDWRYQDAPGRTARRRVEDAGRRAIDEAMDRCADQSAVLAIAVGNEVPADVVRLHGIGAIEDVLSDLVEQVHAADRSMLATYCNYPTTEYLEIEGQDLICFNVFLEDAAAFRRYVRHLQVVSGEQPLLLTELGLASNLHGETAQAESLSWQLRITDECGCAGATIFSWTDEWGVGGKPVEGWGFGLTDSDRKPRQALEVVKSWTRSSTSDLRSRWPRISVIVCAYNGEQLVEKCLASLQKCNYPELEVIVCDDGSSDRTLEVAHRFPFKVLELERGGLGAARNAGIAASTGELIAFIDADAYCHPEWPYYLALSLEDDNVVATGGPNLPVPSAGLRERAVVRSPGGPIHVLLSDDRAEHVPGCNMAYKKDALESVGGFDSVYTAAGDDVDVCWKLLDKGYEIGFAPAAQVRHHRRNTVRGYLKQQRGYGRAERLLQRRHPHRFNRFGQARWSGFIYGGLRVLPGLLRPIVYHGAMGTAPFQPITRRPSELLIAHLQPFVPVALLAALLAAPLTWLSPWAWVLVSVPLAFVIALAAVVASGVPREPFASPSVRLRLLVATLHLLQPVVRLGGRLRTRPLPRHASTDVPWTGEREQWLLTLEQMVLARKCRVRRGGAGDDWDLEVVRGPLVRAHVTAAVLWHWTPVARVSYRPRGIAFAAVLGGALAAAWLPGPGLAIAALASGGGLVDALLLRAMLQEVVAAATKASRGG